jgi:hypothetical protein
VHRAESPVTAPWVPAAQSYTRSISLIGEVKYAPFVQRLLVQIASPRCRTRAYRPEPGFRNVYLEGGVHLSGVIRGHLEPGSWQEGGGHPASGNRPCSGEEDALVS